jgi:hypothetical protein
MHSYVDKKIYSCKNGCYIWKGQVEDKKIKKIKCNIKEEKSPGFIQDNQDVLWYKLRIYVSNIKELKGKVL